VKAARTVTTGGMERRIERHRALSLPTHSLSGASKYYYAPVYQGILVGRRKGNEDNGPDRRRPYAMKVARAVTTGGMERRVAGYRALSLPTRQAAKPPGLATRSRAESTRGGFRPTGKSPLSLYLARWDSQGWETSARVASRTEVAYCTFATIRMVWMDLIYPIPAEAPALAGWVCG